MAALTGDSTALITIIANATSIIEGYHKASSKPYIPSLDDTSPHPLDNEVLPLKVKEAVQMLEGACTQLCATVTRPSNTIVNRMMNIYQPACLGVALNAKIADILLETSSGMHVTEISKKSGVEPRKLARVLRLLSSQHIFREVSNDIFANNRLSMQLLQSNPLHSLGQHFTDEDSKATTLLADTLLDPEIGHSYAAQHSPFNRSTSYPHPLWHYYEETEKGAIQGARFAIGMVGWNDAIDAKTIVTEFPWDQLPKGATVNDVGGGWGHIAMQLYRRYPNLLLKVQDLPERVEQAKTQVWPKECPEAIADNRIEFKKLDFLQESPIPNCDVYLLKNIIHSWPDATATQILNNISKVMGPTSRILIHEYIVQSASRVPEKAALSTQAPLPLLPNYGAGRSRQYNLDMAMMVMSNSEERRLDSYIKLGKAAGLEFVQLWNLGEMDAIEFRLAN